MQKELSKQEKRIFEDMPAMQSVLTLAVPTVISQIITVIYNLSDTYFIGRANNSSMVAAVAICMPLMLAITGMANLFGIGGSSVIARCLGVKNFSKAQNASAFSVWGGCAVIVAYSLILFFFGDSILWLLGSSTDTFVYCHTYTLWVCVVGGLPTMMSTLLAHLIRSEGAAKEASIGISLGGILNIAFDPLFMFIILPKGYEVTGAAIATMLSNFAADIYFITYLIRHRKSSVLSLNPRDLSFKDRIPLEVVEIGLPSFFMTVLSSFSNAVVNNLLSAASSAAIAGMGVAKKINMLSFRVSTGITQGALPLISYNYSAGNLKRTKSSISSSGSLAVGFAALCMCVSFALGGDFVRFFIDDADTVNYGRHFIRIICAAMPLASISMTAMMFFQATSKKLQATVLSVFRKGVLDVPLMFLFNSFWPIYGVACATPITEVISAVTSIVLVMLFFKKVAPAKPAEHCEH